MSVGVSNWCAAKRRELLLQPEPQKNLERSELAVHDDT
jgi:hypothetical protein